MGEIVKNTPAKWADIKGYIVVKGGHTIASVNSYNTSEGKANARLIAAAPDLLDTAERVLIAWGKLAEALPQDNRIEALEFGEFMDLRTAVSNARGIHSWELGRHLQDLEARP